MKGTDMAGQNVLGSTYEWFLRAVPVPTNKNLHVQLGVHFEEVAEMVDELYSHDVTTAKLIAHAHEALAQLSIHLKTHDNVICFPDRVSTLDAICDQLVTATGVARMMHMDPVGGLFEVNRSNWSKFVNGEPQFNAQGKIMKGESYSPPNLTPFV